MDLFNTDSIVLLDGAFGTELHKKILPPAALPEEYSLTAPEAVRSIHRSYIQAGSQRIMANTFGACGLRLEPAGLDLDEVISAAVRLAKEAAEGADIDVALDIGPLGALLEPMGTLSFEDAYDQFAAMVEAGVRAGADSIAIETMTDLREVKAALLAAKEHSDLPVSVTMTFEENGRTFTGCTMESMVCLCESLKADAIGINCSLGPDQLEPLLERLCSLTSLPVIAKPNAGLPDPLSGAYHFSDEAFVQAALRLAEKGVSIVGGCCGTTPETIRELSDALKGRKRKVRGQSAVSSLCTPTQTVPLDAVCIVGERINPTGKKRMQQALLDGDLDYIARLAIAQQEAGADILDINVGYPGVDEETMLPIVIEAVQSVCDLPLLLDSSDPKALEAGLRAVNGRAAINSVNGKQESMEAILPLAARFGAPVVALCLDEEGVPQTKEKRLEIADRIAHAAAEHGIPFEDLWFDALTLTVSAQQDQALKTLETIEELARQRGAATILGVSNISFGLPQRSLMTRTFLAAALQAGLRFAIINPSISELTDTVRAWKVLNGQDKGCRVYTEYYANRSEAAPAAAAAPSEMTLAEAVYKGLESQAAQAAAAQLEQGTGELELAETQLIPALDAVGSDYEKGVVYLPTLLAAAGAAQAVFEVIRSSLACKGEQQASRGTIVLGTVQGDVHDIGKNIVRTLLENYGYRVIDLGRDVDPKRVLQAVVDHGAPLVGLSALMTTTLPSMEKTIALLHTLKNPPKIMVGGAVVTEEAAREMQADFYAKDARASVRFADEVFGYEQS